MINKFKNKIKTRFPNGGFARNSIILITGSSVAQLITILASPFLTRLYSPSDFGAYAIYTSILAILGIVSCWRYDTSIVLPKDDEDASNLLGLSVVVCFLSTIFTLFFFLFFGKHISRLLGISNFSNWLLLLPISVLSVGLFQIFNYWNIRQNKFKRLAKREITQSVTISTSSIIFGGAFSLLGAGGLVLGNVLGQFVATAKLILETNKEDGERIINLVNKSKMKEMLFRYKNFPLFSSWGILLSTTSATLPSFLLGYFFTPAVLGYYTLGTRIISLPMRVIGGSISKVFFSRATEAKRSKNIEKITQEMFKHLISIGIVPILLVSIIAPDFFAFVFGSEWRSAGVYVRWFSVWLFFVFVSTPLSNIYSVMEKQRKGLLVDIIMFVSRLAALFVGGISGDELLTIALFGITGAVLWLANCFYMLHLAGVSILTSLATLIKQLLYSIPYSIPPILAILTGQKSITLIASALFSGVIFLVLHTSKLTGVRN